MMAVKFLAWVIAIWFTFVNVTKIIRNQDVSAMNFALQAVAITTIIFMW